LIAICRTGTAASPVQRSHTANQQSAALDESSSGVDLRKHDIQK